MNIKRVFVPVLFGFLLSACGGGPDASYSAVEPGAGTVCSLDGMRLADYPGPKAQIHYTTGAPDFFCDTIELFSVHLRSEQGRRIQAMYVQDMGAADWKHPQGHWIDARTAFYIVGSDQHGSMGPTIASFADQAQADAFAKQHGGKLYRFEQITPDMVSLDGGVLNDEHS
ncbi:MAG: nitrous oxide reductase accessory protein NosL [Rhodanobacter sp.]|nr:nitrous oxide reductase accessory protein NosL [Rhodanobacter sp.]